MGITEKDKLVKTGWRSECSDNWHGQNNWKKKAEDALVASVFMKYIAVPLSLYAFLAHIPGKGLHFTMEVMQTYLHLVTMDMSLHETKLKICIANNQEEWTHNTIFWQKTVPGSSLWLITSKRTTSFGSAFSMKRKKVRDVAFQMKKEEAESLTSAEQLAFLVLPSVK